MKNSFNIRKAIAATSILLNETQHNCMEYLRLLKLLYIADREILAETDSTLLGGRVVAMKNGPLHSRIYDLIKGEDASAQQWQKFFKTHSYSIHLSEVADTSPLSRFEIRKLKDICARHTSLGTWDLVDLTHDFPEWKAAYPNPQEDTSRTIEFQQIVDAVGRSDDFDFLNSVMTNTSDLESL